MSTRNLLCHAICLLMLLTACSNRENEPETKLSETDRRTAWLEKNKEEWAALSKSPDPDRILDRLIESGKHDSVLEKEAGPEDLLLLVANDDAGICLFDLLYTKYAEESPNRAAGLVVMLQARALDSKAALAALDRSLTALAREDASAFTSRCEEIIASQTKGKSRRLALLRRAEHCESNGDPKAAALDILSMCADYPEFLRVPGVCILSLRILANAGFSLEKEMVDVYKDSPDLLAVVANDMREYLARGCATADTFPKEGANAYASVYFALAPSLDAISSKITLETLSASNETISFLVRLLALCDSQTPRERTLDLLRALGTQANSLASLPKETAGMPTSREIRYADVALKRVARILGAAGTNPNAQAELLGLPPAETLARDELALALTAPTYFLAQSAVRSDSAITEHFAELSETYAMALKSKAESKKAIQVYDQFIEMCPSSFARPRMLLAAAEYEASVLQTPTKAEERYQRLLDEYSDTPEAQKGRFALALLLYKNESYEKAYVTLQPFLTGQSESATFKVRAKFLCALCESALGDTEQAEADMRDIANQIDDVAPRALYWLANNRLAQQQYPAARNLLQELTERFPESAYVSEAQSMIKRLEKILETTAK